MKYLLLLGVLPFWYCFSFAVFNWKNKNRMGAAGVMIMLIASIILTVFLYFSNHI